MRSAPLIAYLSRKTQISGVAIQKTHLLAGANADADATSARIRVCFIMVNYNNKAESKSGCR
jgi:hypothetical protein